MNSLSIQPDCPKLVGSVLTDNFSKILSPSTIKLPEKVFVTNIKVSQGSFYKVFMPLSFTY